MKEKWYQFICAIGPMFQYADTESQARKQLVDQLTADAIHAKGYELTDKEAAEEGLWTED